MTKQALKNQMKKNNITYIELVPTSGYVRSLEILEMTGYINALSSHKRDNYNATKLTK
jgi:hypothetical protein